MTFAQVLQPAIEMAENGFPIGERMAGAIAGSRKLKKYPIEREGVLPGRRSAEAGRHLQEPGSGDARCGSWSRPEKENAGKGRHEALKAARDRFYKGDIARAMAKFSEEQGGLFRYEDFASYTDKVETPVSDGLSRVSRLQEPVGEPGPDGAVRPESSSRATTSRSWATTARTTSTPASKR